mmetsp:Transcript_3563/g.9390  ORF Transcript_3563/g.9390 Transcript_3563/m.9390 type:complete len:203 (+) Transcript_3563:1918-2526(+)
MGERFLCCLFRGFAAVPAPSNPESKPLLGSAIPLKLRRRSPSLVSSVITAVLAPPAALAAPFSRAPAPRLGAPCHEDTQALFSHPSFIKKSMYMSSKFSKLITRSPPATSLPFPFLGPRWGSAPRRHSGTSASEKGCGSVLARWTAGFGSPGSRHLGPSGCGAWSAPRPRPRASSTRAVRTSCSLRMTSSSSRSSPRPSDTA